MVILKFLLALPGVAMAQDGFRPLFDGKTLNGWKVCNGHASYRVEEREIVGTTAEGSPNSFLCTEKEYGDFILEFETKTDPALNSGVQIRSHQYPADTKVMTNNGRQIVERKHPAGRVHGYQVEIANESSGASGGIYDEARRGWLHNIQKDPAASRAFQDHQWNRYRVEAIGDHIRTWINGVPCADLVDPMDQTGFLALQVHAYKGAKPVEVRWRNIRIQDLGRHAWRPLWDGKSMNGWSRAGGGDWTIENEAIHARSIPADNRIGFLISDRSFRDVTVRVKYKMTEGNSGFFVRADKQTLAGYEVEIDDRKGTGGLFETGGRKWVTGPENNAAVRADDWNELVASVHGDRVVFHLNGIKTVDLPGDTGGRKEGHIALQVHGRRTTGIRFRDIAMLEAVK
ncbi:MAG: DUF1080 domain-containing protein [Acidobacteria bacterium]|nr:DUF1080 domain-containing protein [Acidobacteriota bacterium]